MDWINRGRQAQEVKHEAIDEQTPLFSRVTPILRVESIARNCIRVRWTIAEKKLRSKTKSVTSPDLKLWPGGTFTLTLRSSCPHNMKGGFQASRGVGRVELKFCGETEFTWKVHFRVAVGQNTEFQGLDHDFGTRPQSTLQQEWNFRNAVNKGSLLLLLEAHMEK